MRVVNLFALAGLAASLALGQSDLTAALDQIASSELAKQKIPGMAALVVKSDEIAWSAGLGVTSLESRTPVSSSTLFRVGSARPILAAAAFELSQQGRLHLDTPAGDYLFELNDRQAALSTQKLLSPPSGIDEEAVAARLIEMIRARPASALLDEMVFAPLEMEHTTFAPALAMTYPLALGHTTEGKVSRPMEANALFSSTDDLARFLLAFLHSGMPRDPLGDKRNEREALSPAVIAALSSDSGYGFDLDAARGLRLIRWVSTAPGYAGAILMAPEFQTGVVVLANRDGASASAIALKLLERALPVRFPQTVSSVVPAR